MNYVFVFIYLLSCLLFQFCWGVVAFFLNNPSYEIKQIFHFITYFGNKGSGLISGVFELRRFLNGLFQLLNSSAVDYFLIVVIRDRDFSVAY